MKNLDDILELEEEKEFNFNLDVSIEESLDYTSIDKSDGNIIRIEETIGDGWHGVRNCCSSDRIDSVANRIKDKWVAKKMFENDILDGLDTEMKKGQRGAHKAEILGQVSVLVVAD
jgi:hypothetical protein